MLEALGIDFVDLEGVGCCGSPDMASVSRKAALTVAAWNLALAEEQGVDVVMTLCNGCNEVLARAVEALKDPKAREEVNAILANVKREYKGRVVVKHVVRVLYEDVGLDKVREAAVRPFKGLKVAVHYGCHLIKPSEVLKFDDPNAPRSLDELVEATGAISVPYLEKLECCGLPVLAVREELAYSIAKDKLRSAREAGAEAIITACPFCYLHLENTQIMGGVPEEERLPVLHFTQLLGLAMGFEPDDVGLYENKIDASGVLEKL
ncbi:hypothetical protein DRO60_03295 [Candidatus Bathyarchaeota archaeon]|nr:MAG: hypothetical protein DRO60_03295 [Candidatus Bathyarchaeota archaeon]